MMAFRRLLVPSLLTVLIAVILGLFGMQYLPNSPIGLFLPAISAIIGIYVYFRLIRRTELNISGRESAAFGFMTAIIWTIVYTRFGSIMFPPPDYDWFHPVAIVAKIVIGSIMYTVGALVCAFILPQVRPLPRKPKPYPPLKSTLCCPKCGTALLEDAEFCPNCGTRVIAIPAPKAEIKPVHQWRTLALVILVGLPLLIMGIYMMYDNLIVSIRFLKTTGIVTSYVDTGEGSGYFTVRFIDQRTGQPIIGATNYGEWSASGIFVHVGDRVNIFYDPQNPTNIRVDSIDLWLWPTVTTFTGIFSVIYTIHEIWRKVERKRLKF